MRQAASELTVKLRKHDTLTPDSLPPAGLVVASSKNHADKIALLLEDITGEEPLVVHGGRPNNKEMIRQFTDGTLPNKWLVSVGMVSEGVDIPRIKVLAYLTSARTELVFHQIIGRSMRARVQPSGEPLSEYASIFMPSTPRLHEYVSNFIVREPKFAIKSIEKVSVEETELVDRIKPLRIIRQELISSAVIGVQQFLNGVEQRANAVNDFIAEMMTKIQTLILTNVEEQKI